MEMSAFTLWLLAGIVFMAIEAIGIPGMGFLFAGLGALTVGVWLNFASDTNTITQFVIFFGATTVWAGLLWKPLQKFRVGKTGGYNNIIGDDAFVGEHGLKKGAVGEATWSGTIMKAELSPDASVESLSSGDTATIIAVSGNKLILKPKK